MKVEGSVVLFTGANGGIGRSLVHKLLRRGEAEINFGARDPVAVQHMPSISHRLVPLVRDVTKPDEAGHAAEVASDITLFINNAGALPEPKRTPAEVASGTLAAGKDQVFPDTLSQRRGPGLRGGPGGHAGNHVGAGACHRPNASPVLSEGARRRRISGLGLLGLPIGNVIVWRKQSLVLAGALLVTAGSLAGCKPSEAEAPDPRTAERQVVVAQAENSAGTGSSYTGVVSARIESGLGFRVQGKVVERLVDTGQVVKRGQPLMRMDPTDYGNALVAQTGNVAAARAKWIQAAADERRNRGLAATGAISQSAYDQVKAAADSAKALLDAAVAQERVAQNQEDYSLLLADSDGTVMQTLAEPGQVVAPGQVVVRLAHAGPREAVINLPEMVRPAIASTALASLYGTSLYGTSLHGTSLYGTSLQGPARLRQLSDTADPRTRTFEARYVMTGAAASAPLGTTVTVAFEGPGQTGLISIPIGAINDEGHGPGVWVLDSGTSTVSYRSVQVKSFGGETAEIQGGLTTGETVVAAGGHFLHDGEKVRPIAVRAAMR